MKISKFLPAITFAAGATERLHRRSSNPDLYAFHLPRSGRDLTGWNRGINGAVTVGRAFDDRETRTVTPKNYLEFMIASGKFGTAEEIKAAFEASQRLAGRRRRGGTSFFRMGY